MGMQPETELERDALKISVDARLRLAAKLLASVPGPFRVGIGEEQALDLAEARATELDSGEVEGLSYPDEMQRIRKSLPQ